MSSEYYTKLALNLDLLPGGFPATNSGVEIRILQKLFSPVEAMVATNMSRVSETTDAIAERVDLTEQETDRLLRSMMNRGLVWGSEKEGVLRCRLAPFIVGIWDDQWEAMDHELAHLTEQYWQEGGAKAIMSLQPAFHRVVPAQKSLKTEVILPYDDVKSLFLQAKTFQVRDCICRKEQDLVGQRKCDFPLEACLAFSVRERPGWTNTVSQEEALDLLDKVEEIGLVHTVSNVAKGLFYVCNCCSCCCLMLRSIAEFGVENSVAKANYYAVIDSERCTACGICEERCQMGACTMSEIAMIDISKCIGCGLCVTGCPEESVTLILRPDAEIVHPPENFRAWEEQRLRNRGF